MCPPDVLERPTIGARSALPTRSRTHLEVTTGLPETAAQRRFGQLQRILEGVSPKVLTQTLRRLQEHGFVDRTIYPAVPLHVDYALTDLGQRAAVPLQMLRDWVENNMDEIATSGCGPAA
ncbi:helix-turn-helix domain-containing protein [Actinoplanes sp. M2I2]|uniref:winged helix-turn-helix transcriptional regulator n=1 Tax=Actinoplanes sp. M2I2 TaxID=1734444 RepID=UPI0024C29B7F|nr:helix-turn-helix domain-containing protein [Actinoplanes sp. M2I2]